MEISRDLQIRIKDMEYSIAQGMEALADALAGMLADPLRLKIMAREGRRAVEEKYNAKILTEKMVGVYK